MSTSTSPYAQYFSHAPGYLAAATGGLPSIATVRAIEANLAAWQAGKQDAATIQNQVEELRELFAGLCNVDSNRVAIGSQTSQLVSIVATGVPDGGEVLCVTGDFSSLTHPFEQLSSRGVTVRYASLAELANAITATTSLVAVSHVQSATGEVADLDAIAAAAARHGARMLVDTTQSLGWLPLDASRYDFTVCHSYKWLCCPRGVTFLTVREGLDDSLTPLAAGWCSADDVWGSCYAGHTPLAAGAGRFDLSPIWQAVGGSVAALQLFASLDAAEIHKYTVGLANAARAALNLPVGNSAIVTWPDSDGSALAAIQAAGIVASGRAGNARVSFHIFNDMNDVTMLAKALEKAS